ncbi:MAG: TIGR03618 family F420-dependent PPOX class oxidoreductase [Streptomycetaceae bacterium]|nr:TIGR03618 family F420-dependent PPOX class oxidoreductase [Streptomycetaceae bacterium]NUS55719.1 TIGR03618 family F420-dependent PPOX class oxidoreductase [Streptomycetaceae bacterium]
MADRRQGVLATVGRDGTPHLSNVHYVCDAEARILRISTTAGRAKGRNLLRDGRAVLHVGGPDFFTFAVAEGVVTVAVPTAVGDPVTDELYGVHAVFNGAAERPRFDERMLRDGRMIVRIAVTRLYGLIPPP